MKTMPLMRRLPAKTVLTILTGFVLGIGGHFGWFAWRLHSGAIAVDMAPISPFSLYFATHEVLEGSVFGCLVGVTWVVILLAFGKHKRHP